MNEFEITHSFGRYVVFWVFGYAFHVSDTLGL